MYVAWLWRLVSLACSLCPLSGAWERRLASWNVFFCRQVTGFSLDELAYNIHKCVQNLESCEKPSVLHWFQVLCFLLFLRLEMFVFVVDMSSLCCAFPSCVCSRVVCCCVNFARLINHLRNTGCGVHGFLFGLGLRKTGEKSENLSLKCSVVCILPEVHFIFKDSEMYKTVEGCTLYVGGNRRNTTLSWIIVVEIFLSCWIKMELFPKWSRKKEVKGYQINDRLLRRKSHFLQKGCPSNI